MYWKYLGLLVVGLLLFTAGYFCRGTKPQSLPEMLVRRASDPDPTIRAAAVKAIGGILDDSAKIEFHVPDFDHVVFPSLMEALEDPDESVRYAACSALRLQTGEDAIVRGLVLRIKTDPSPAVRMQAAASLGLCLDPDHRYCPTGHSPAGDDAFEGIVPALRRHLAGSDVSPRPEIIALGSILKKCRNRSDSIPEGAASIVLSCLDRLEWSDCDQCIAALQESVYQQTLCRYELVATLCDKVRGGDYWQAGAPELIEAVEALPPGIIRLQATEHLADAIAFAVVHFTPRVLDRRRLIPELSAEITSSLVSSLDSADQNIRIQAATGLVRLGEPTKEAIEIIASSYPNSNGPVSPDWYDLGDDLMSMQDVQGPVLDALRIVLVEGPEELQPYVAISLAKHGVQDSTVLAVLENALTLTGRVGDRTAIEAAAALIEMNVKTDEAVQAIGTSSASREDMRQAFGQGFELPRDAFENLIEQLAKSDNSEATMVAIGRYSELYGDESVAYVDQVLNAMNSREWTVRNEARRCLQSMLFRAKGKALSTLAKRILEDGEPFLQYFAVDAVMRPDSGIDKFPAMIEMYQGTDEFVSRAVERYSRRLDATGTSPD